MPVLSWRIVIFSQSWTRFRSKWTTTLARPGALMQGEIRAPRRFAYGWKLVACEPGRFGPSQRVGLPRHDQRRPAFGQGVRYHQPQIRHQLDSDRKPRITGNA